MSALGFRVCGFLSASQDRYMDNFDLLMAPAPFVFLAGSVFLFVLAKITSRKNKEFIDAALSEGKIISLRKTSGESSNQFFPTVEYTWFSENKTFESTLAINGGKVGQLIDVEINSQGKARLFSKYNNYWVIILYLVSAIVFSVASFKIYYQFIK